MGYERQAVLLDIDEPLLGDRYLDRFERIIDFAGELTAFHFLEMAALRVRVDRSGHAIAVDAGVVLGSITVRHLTLGDVAVHQAGLEEGDHEVHVLAFGDHEALLQRQPGIAGNEHLHFGRVVVAEILDHVETRGFGPIVVGHRARNVLAEQGRERIRQHGLRVGIDTGDALQGVALRRLFGNAVRHATLDHG
jgi:hypothetical protein